MKSLAITTAVLVLGVFPLTATPVTMYLEGGRTLSVDFDHVNDDGVTWRLNPDDPNTQLTPLSQISHIDFPPPSAWEEAEEILATGNLSAAFEKFAAIAKNQYGHGYPIPGNYASKALLKLLAIQRRTLNAAAIADQARAIKREAATLTPEERQLDPAIESWIALSKEEYEAALQSLEAIEDGNSEISYLRGRALEGIGKIESAVESYAETYTLGIGDRSEMSQDALRRSVLILDSLEREERFPEVHAQLKLYAELYGAGELWPGAPEHLIKTANTDLNTITGMVDKPIVAEPDPEPEPEPPAVPAKVAAIAVNPAKPGGDPSLKPGTPPGIPTNLAPPSETPYEPPLLTYNDRDLEPLDKRDWTLPQEIDQRIYFINEKPFTADGTKETDTGLAFDGESSVLRFTPTGFRRKGIRIRSMFTPRTTDAILLHAGNGDNGTFGLYIVDGDLLLYWRPTEDRKTETTTFNLGKVLLDQVNTLGLSTPSKTDLKGNLNGQPFDFTGYLPNVLQIRQKIDVRISGNVGNLLIDRNLPKFKGEIHYFSIGADANITNINKADKALHDGRYLRFAPPVEPPLVP